MPANLSKLDLQVNLLIWLGIENKYNKNYSTVEDAKRIEDLPSNFFNLTPIKSHIDDQTPVNSRNFSYFYYSYGDLWKSSKSQKIGWKT